MLLFAPVGKKPGYGRCNTKFQCIMGTFVRFVPMVGSAHVNLTVKTLAQTINKRYQNCILFSMLVVK